MPPVPALVASAVVGALCWSADLCAQARIPDTAARAEADNNTAYPWGRGFLPTRVLYVYDRQHFVEQGISAPIRIDRLRWRSEGGDSRAGYTLANVQVRLSTAAVTPAGVHAAFDQNHGADVATVHNGPVTVATPVGQSPGEWYVDLPVQPFAYDPGSGDLALEVIHDGVGPVVSVGPLLDAAAGPGSRASRVYAGSTAAATGTVQPDLCPVVELDYAPQAGIVAAFAGTPRGGPTPLQVVFEDRSRTADPGGIAAWQWDFDGDGAVDSTQQHPTHVYTACGSYDVTLTVRDAVGTASFTRPVYVETDDIVPEFTVTRLPGLGAGFVQFDDVTDPPATGWAWDFDGDGATDSTLAHPLVQLPLCELATVRLEATRLCRTAVVQHTFAVAGGRLETTYAANNNGLSGWGLLFDLTVLNPAGISLCALETNAGATAVGTPFAVDVLVTDGPAATRQVDASAWRLVGTATGTAAGIDRPSAAALPQPVLLPAGAYGVALFHRGCAPRYTANGSPTTVANADIRLDLGIARSLALGPGGLVFHDRSWNGALFYDTCGTGGLAAFGWLAPGCAGTGSASRQTALSLPRLGGRFTLQFDALPHGVAVAMMGFDRAQSPLGPLPIDLVSLGAPGCTAWVYPELSWFVLGAADRAELSLSIPRDPVFQCLQFYTQAMVFDARANALGLVLGDAAAGVIGG